MDWLIGLLGGIAALLVAGLLPDEIRDWADRWAAMLARSYARRVPESLRDRVEEEWLAELTAIPGKMSKLAFAWHLQFAALEISRQYRLPHVSLRFLAVIRGLDVVVATIALLLLLPFMLSAAVFIRFGLRRDVFARTPTHGLHGHTFYRYHFNTKDYPFNAKANDQPRTYGPPIASWLDAVGLDEAPALWNVLRGDMTLIGTVSHIDWGVWSMGLPDRPAPIVRIRPGFTIPSGLVDSTPGSVCSSDEWFVANYSAKAVLQVAVYAVKRRQWIYTSMMSMQKNKKDLL